MIRKWIARILLVAVLTVGIVFIWRSIETKRDYDLLTEVEIYRSGTMNPVKRCFSLRLEDGQWVAEYAYSRFLEEQVSREDADIAFVHAVKDLLIENRVSWWDGFDRENRWITDGEYFAFTATFSDGTTTQAYGYMAYPANFEEVWDGFEDLYAHLIEDVGQ